MQKQDLELVDRLYHLTFALQGRLARRATAHALSLTQVRLLGILRDHTPTMQQLAAHLDLEKSSLSGLIDRAEDRGLVERLAAPEDARLTRVRMTRRGRTQVDAVARQLAEEVADITAGLSEAEKLTLSGLVARLLKRESGLVEAGDTAGPKL